MVKEVGGRGLKNAFFAVTPFCMGSKINSWHLFISVFHRLKVLKLFRMVWKNKINGWRVFRILNTSSNFEFFLKILKNKEHVQILIGHFSSEVTRKYFRSSRPKLFCKKGALENFEKLTGKHLCQNLFFNKVAGLRPATLLKKRLWYRYFLVNFARFLRTPFSIKDPQWLLLNITEN